VASTLGCVIAQRLVRRLCKDCRRPEEPSSRDLRYLEIERREAARIGPMTAPGCPACDHAGFRGRVAVHEVLIPSDDLRDAVLRRAPSRELRELALETEVFLSLREDGLLKVSDGTTSVSELADRVPRGVAPRALQRLYETAARRSHG
jgi:type IV pilus assembly protein PilB